MIYMILPDRDLAGVYPPPSPFLAAAICILAVAKSPLLGQESAL